MFKSSFCAFSMFIMPMLSSMQYQCIPLEIPEGKLDEVMVLNAQGTVLGIGTSPQSEPFYFLWNAKDGIKNLNQEIPDLQEVIGMNDKGSIVGFIHDRIFLWKDRRVQILDGSFQNVTPIGINNQNTVLFSKVNDQQKLEYYLWKGDKAEKVVVPELNDLGGVISFNDIGQMLYLNMAEGNFSIVQNGKSTLFAEPGNFLIASKMNQKGDVAGIRITEKSPRMSGIVWLFKGKTHTVTKPGYDVALIDVNDRAQALGAIGEEGNDDAEAKPILWSEKDGITFINDLIDPKESCHVDFALKINGKGQILAWGNLSNKASTFLLLQPKK